MRTKASLQKNMIKESRMPPSIDCLLDICETEI